MKTPDVALAPVNMLTFLLGIGAIVASIVYGSGSCATPPAASSAEPMIMPDNNGARIDDLRMHVDKRIDDLRIHVDNRFDDLRDLITNTQD